MELIDIGLNLMHKQYKEDRDNIMVEAKEVGVQKAIITGVTLKSSMQAAEYAAKFPGTLYSTCGIHPHNAKSCDENTMAELEEIAKQDQVVAIGECGLDYNRNFSPQDVQKKWFEEHLKLAEKLDMPVFLHDREGFPDFSDILRKYPDVAERSVVHCFTGTKEEVEEYISLGCSIGVTGFICDDNRGDCLREAVHSIPRDKLMVETDGPFLVPKDFKQRVKSRRNVPKYLPHILIRLAHELDVPAAELAKDVTKNSKELFNI